MYLLKKNNANKENGWLEGVVAHILYLKKTFDYNLVKK